MFFRTCLVHETWAFDFLQEQSSVDYKSEESFLKTSIYDYDQRTQKEIFKKSMYNLGSQQRNQPIFTGFAIPSLRDELTEAERSWVPIKWFVASLIAAALSLWVIWYAYRRWDDPWLWLRINFRN